MTVRERQVAENTLRNGIARSKTRRLGEGRLTVASAAALSLCMVLAACGSSRGSDKATSSGGAKGAPSGSAIKVMQILDVTGNVFPQPAIGEAGKATVADINANGGISGHPIKLTVCDGQGDPNQTAACARKAVSSGDVAVIGSSPANQASVMPVLTAAKIPYIPSFASAPSEFSSPISYTISSGLIAIAGEGILAGQNCKSSVLAAADYPGIDFNLSLVQSGLKSAGKPTAKVVKVPLTPGDYSAQAAQIVASKAECVVSLLSAAQELALFPTMEGAGSKQRIVGSTGTLTTEVFKKVPKLTAGALDVDNAPAYTGPKWAPFRAIVAKYSNPKKFQFNGAGPELAYLAFKVFQQVAQKVVTKSLPITAPNLITTLNQTTDLETGGLLPTLDFSKTAPLKGFTRAFGRSVTFETNQNGTLKSLDNDKFHDVTAVMQAVIGKP